MLWENGTKLKFFWNLAEIENICHRLGPPQVFAGSFCFGLAKRSTVGIVGIGLCRGAIPNHSFHHNQCGLVLFGLSGGNGFADSVIICIALQDFDNLEKKIGTRKTSSKLANK